MIGLSTKRAAIVIVIATAGTVLLTGCGPTQRAGAAGGAVPSGPAATAGAGADTGSAVRPVGGGSVPDPCALITENDATAAIGKPSGPGVPGGTADVPQCVYGDGVLIIVVDNAGKDGYDSNHSSLTLGPAGSWQDVSGVGDGAFEVNGGPTALVYFYKGTTQVEIILHGTLTAPIDAAIAVARAAAARA
jgi:hypothetical protein